MKFGQSELRHTTPLSAARTSPTPGPHAKSSALHGRADPTPLSGCGPPVIVHVWPGSHGSAKYKPGAAASPIARALRYQSTGDLLDITVKRRRVFDGRVDLAGRLVAARDEQLEIRLGVNPLRRTRHQQTERPRAADHDIADERLGYGKSRIDRLRGEHGGFGLYRL